jgi:hypothetical protein
MVGEVNAMTYTAVLPVTNSVFHGVGWEDYVRTLDELFAALGVAEIWRCADQRLRLLVLTTSGKYEERERGLAFPSLSIIQMNHFLQLALTQSSHTAALAIRDWARAGSV